MDYYQMMEWNTRWECENLDIFCSKYNGTPRKLEVTNWVVKEGETDVQSFNLFGGSGCSTSDFGHVSSAKSSIAASTECSSKEGIRASNLTSDSFGGFLADFTNKNELETAELPRTSPSVDTSVGSSELSIGLKLGKRTYFENSSAGNNSTTSSKIPVSSTLTPKKSRLPCQNAPTPICQVEACNLDLSSAKEYHRKHRVCESHSKCSKVIVGGLERRFCQQCSRFHSLSEFDEKKRSCRRRLSDHNARRRKPQQETVHFSSACKSSLINEGVQQMNLVSRNAAMCQTRPSESSTWENMHTSKHALHTGYLLKPEISSIVDVQSHLSGCQLPSPTKIPSQSSSMLMQCKGISERFGRGSQFMFPSNLHTAADLHRALSLLSTNSSSSSDQGSVGLNHSTNATYKNIPHHEVCAVPQRLPFHSPECGRNSTNSLIPVSSIPPVFGDFHFQPDSPRQIEVQPSDTHTHTFAANSNHSSNNEEIKLLSAPYSTEFYSD